MGPPPLRRLVPLPCLRVGGAAAESQRLQEAVRAAARAGAGLGPRFGSWGRRGAPQLNLYTPRPVRTARGL